MRRRLRAITQSLFKKDSQSPRPTYRICDDLAAWAATWPDTERWVLEPAFTTSRTMPTTIDGELDATFPPLGEVAVPERALVKVPRGRLRSAPSARNTHVGLVLLPDDAFVGELVALTPEGRRTMLEREPSYREPLPARADEKAGNYYAFLGHGAHHYYHWSHDLIMGSRGIADHLPPDTQLIVPPAMRPFQIETLALLGLDEHPRIPFAADEYWELENLYVVTPRLKTQIDSPEPFRWFRAAAMARYTIPETTPSRRLYLSRRDDNHWRTTNEPEVEQLLAGYGFETVMPGRASLRDQVEMFAAAEAIVGTGAGLFNMVFAPPGTKVLQFQEPTHMIHALWTEAAAMGFEYAYVVANSVPNPAADDADLYMPLEKLAAALRLIDLA